MTTETMELSHAQMLGFFDSLAALGSNAKVQALREHPEVTDVVLAALDPFITYGVTGAKARQMWPEVQGDSDEWGAFQFELLSRLRHRRLTGYAAAEYLRQCKARLSAPAWELFARVLDGDLRAGVGIATWNKAHPDQAIKKFQVQRAEAYDPDRVKEWAVLVQPKIDGVRVIAICDVEGDAVSFLSREGHKISTLDHMKPTLLRWAASLQEARPAFFTRCVVFDGEVVAGRNFNGTLSAVRKKDRKADDAYLYVFDVLTLDQFLNPKTSMPMLDRNAHLGLAASADLEGPVGLLPWEVAHSDAEVRALYKAYREQGHEGAIVKQPRSVYAARKTFDWMKLKPAETLDLPICAVIAGTGRNADTLGGVEVDVDGVATGVAGLDDATRAYMRAEHDAGRLVGRIIEVEFHEKTPDGALRHARYLRFRDTLESGVKE